MEKDVEFVFIDGGKLGKKEGLEEKVEVDVQLEDLSKTCMENWIESDEEWQGGVREKTPEGSTVMFMSWLKRSLYSSLSGIGV